MSDAGADRTNFCYRHPDRQSYILCQRCGRTICPECQTQAPVGVICPECMREQRATAPRTKPAAWTRVRSAAGRGAPVVTYSLIGITALVYLLQWIPGLGVTNALFFSPVFMTEVLPEPWRAITSVFLHSTSLFVHIILNMYTLWIFGRLLEPMLGRVRFLALYLISGLAGSVGVVVFAAPTTQVLGASGAIFGLMGAFVVIQRRLGGNMTQLYILLAINLAIGFIPGANISWQAHLGGLIGGALVGLILLETRSRSRRGLQIGLLIGLTVVLFVIGTVVARWKIGAF
ncbi:membrane associated rhomboid family serine protease [Agromyces sp. 3263]|uniref:rhomboid family intramembrane serine protease n=1 Tax=Agromyces sp. 3263 TaxID=2817750 RepID=UPI00285FAA6E|nr:rhomboid family intramembrane serine protease [Agromyces sp. 3263]MDR6905818.1 membrane associated rhomboid family serine protease [Agromyces sp. 3263]